MSSPVSSRNSRIAAAFSSSLALTSPFGRNHAPSSFFAQKGPPRCTSRNSSSPFWRRYKRSPALTLEDFGIGRRDVLKGQLTATREGRRVPRNRGENCQKKKSLTVASG